MKNPLKHQQKRANKIPDEAVIACSVYCIALPAHQNLPPFLLHYPEIPFLAVALNFNFPTEISPTFCC